MATESADDNNDHITDEAIGHDGDEAHTEGGKRSTTQRSSCNLPPKPKRKSSQRVEVWQHFLLKEDVSGVCTCRYCGVEIGCDSKKAGTSPMRNHISRCKLYKAHVDNDSGSQQVLTGDSKGVMLAVKYDKELFRRSVNEMIVLNELPFSFVESEGFRRFCANVLPMYTVHCRKTATTDIYEMFIREKAGLKSLFGGEKKRVSLTTDIWLAPTTNCSYMVVTAHWVDVNWVLQKRIISFKPVLDHKGETIASHLLNCLNEWSIQKVFTVTVDNAKGNDKALRYFREALVQRGGDALVRNGAHLHMRCCAHVLNLIVKDGLSDYSGSIEAIRNAVKYVRSSGSRLKSFQLRVDTGNASRGSLSLDCTTRWNSTYLMLTAALKQRVAFEKMLNEDKLYNEYFEELDEHDNSRVGPPSAEAWDKAQRFVRFLKIYFNCTLSFSASKTVTSAACYNEIVTIERNLIQLSNHNETQVRNEAMAMRKKFEKYWDGLLNMNPLIIIASFFDPRNKLQFSSLCIEKLYGKDSIEATHLKSSIKDVMKEMYEEYVGRLSTRSDSQGTRSEHSETEAAFEMDLSDEDGYERMDSLYTELASETATEESSSELDIYLLEKVVPRSKNSLGLDYDVLGWWKRNSIKFPILSEFAKDVLAIQVSSVASESAFSTSGRILDPFRSCLSPHMVESLVCTQQWLRTSIQAERVATLTQMFEELEFHDSLVTMFQEEEEVIR